MARYSADYQCMYRSQLFVEAESKEEALDYFNSVLAKQDELSWVDEIDDSAVAGRWELLIETVGRDDG